MPLVCCSFWSCIASSELYPKNIAIIYHFLPQKPLVASQCQHWIKPILLRVTLRAFHSLYFFSDMFPSLNADPLFLLSRSQSAHGTCSLYLSLYVTLFLKVCRECVSFLNEILLIFLLLQMILLPQVFLACIVYIAFPELLCIVCVPCFYPF